MGVDSGGVAVRAVLQTVHMRSERMAMRTVMEDAGSAVPAGHWRLSVCCHCSEDLASVATIRDFKFVRTVQPHYV